MIFTRTKRAADRLAEDLDFRGFAVAAVHGDLGQGARERALRAFRVGKIDILVATDVAARGLDVTGVTHVINYDCPEDQDTYTHRIGRTGRAGATGVAVTFVDWDDMPRWRIIDKTLGLDMPEPLETYHTSPWLYADLDIPTDITGTLPTGERTRAGLSAEVEEDLGGGRRRGPGGRPERPARGRSRRRRRTREGGARPTARPTRPRCRTRADGRPSPASGVAGGPARSWPVRSRRPTAGETLVAVAQPVDTEVAQQPRRPAPAPGWPRSRRLHGSHRHGGRHRLRLVAAPERRKARAVRAGLYAPRLRRLRVTRRRRGLAGQRRQVCRRPPC